MNPVAQWHSGPRRIRSWRGFARRVRRPGHPLLARLGDFPDAVLVAGCQRSGTTAVTHALCQSPSLAAYGTHRDSELAGALILSGWADYCGDGRRRCFQTTYLNERWQEYGQHSGQFRLIWVVRNPHAVVRSLTGNWSRFAFNELFAACGAPLLTGSERRRYRRLGWLAIPRLRRAALCYVGKVAQTFVLMRLLGPERMLIVDYDRLVADRDGWLRRIFEFAELPYQPWYKELINTTSGRKASQLTARQRRAIDDWCGPTYRAALALQRHSEGAGDPIDPGLGGSQGDRRSGAEQAQNCSDGRESQ